MKKVDWLKKLKNELTEDQMNGVKEIFEMTDSVFKVDVYPSEVHVYGEMGGDALHYVYNKYGIGMK